MAGMCSLGLGVLCAWYETDVLIGPLWPPRPGASRGGHAKEQVADQEAMC